ncbi:hypothetical protein R1sor_014512 [Riccia sorocarpa]|uniref:LysM domain-containing protein n=1 Tax=Riccia sorocarpa TaxID=122646 RepID=A0ABD3H9J7_9MARC
MERVLLWNVCAVFVLLSCNAVSAQTLTSTYYQEACYWGTCQSRLSYRAQGEPTLQGIADLFGVDFYDIMGANNLDITKANTLANSKVKNGTIVLIPIRCECINQVRRTNQTVYRVKKGDTLFTIANDIFVGLVPYPEIGKVNNIQDLDNIAADQLLVIPFLCSCPNITAPNPFTIGLTYSVASGDDLTKIANEFGSDATAIQTLNNITDSKSLQAAQIIRVPIPGCKANFSGGAQDGDLIVTKGAYNLTTPADCVQCKCYGDTPTMHCVPNPVLNVSQCPSLDCSTNLKIGNFTTKMEKDGCDVISCEYKGYLYMGKVDKPITQTKEPTCPAYPAVPGPNNLGTIPGSSGSTPGASPGSPGAPGGPPANSSATVLGSQFLLFSAISVAATSLLVV